MRTEAREVTRLVNRLEREFGCTVTRGKGGHWKVTRPGRAMVVLSHTSSDHRAISNMKMDIRRILGITL